MAAFIFRSDASSRYGFEFIEFCEEWNALLSLMDNIDQSINHAYI